MPLTATGETTAGQERLCRPGKHVTGQLYICNRMKFSEGDKIVIRRSGEEGHIIRFIGSDMAEIEAGGTVFPIYLEEIDHPYLRWFTEKNKQATKKAFREQISPEKPAERQARTPSGIHLVFFPEYQILDMEERVKCLKVFLVNETLHTVRIKYEVRCREQLLFSHEGVLPPFTDLYLHYLDWDQMQDIPRFAWELQETVQEQYAVVKDVLRIKPARLFSQLQQLQQENNASFRYTLLTTFPAAPRNPDPVLQPGRPVPPVKKRIRTIQDIPRYEIDLHIEQLIQDTSGLDASGILELQRSALRHALALAVQHMQDRLVIIHGVGKGTLKSVVRQELGQVREVDHFESDWLPGYGFGATIVYFRH